MRPFTSTGSVRTRGSGFTLVELLVVIGIIALLVGILLPALSGARRAANAVKCAAALREIGTCFKMYELDSKGYWPVARIDGWQNPGQAMSQPYEINGVSYYYTNLNSSTSTPPTAAMGYWFTFLAKYATKTKVGYASGSDADAAAQARNNIFFGCPSYQGYSNGLTAGDVNVAQVGYGMNMFPSFTSNYPKNSDPPPDLPSAANIRLEHAIHIVNPGGPDLGNFLHVKSWTRPAERALIADSIFWLAQSLRVPSQASYPPAVTAQIIQRNTTFIGAAQTTIDIYRHGKLPSIQGGIQYDPRGGKISYNILYCDGHVATASGGQEAYRSMRMKFPG